MRLAKLNKVSYPETVAEAVRILARDPGRAQALSGGVSFVFAPLKSVAELVSLSRLPLDYIRAERGALRIGATTRISDLSTAPAVQRYAGGILAEAARRIGSSLNRNLITVGGNLVQPFIWSDLPTVALALSASFVIQGPKGKRRLKASGFFSGMPKHLLRDGELVTEIVFPKLPANSRTAYEIFTLTEVDFAYLKTAVCLVRKGKKCLDPAIAIGSATVLPQRAAAAEKILQGKNADSDLVRAAAEAAAREMEISRDIRCPESYKRDLARTQVREILERLLLDHREEKWK